MIFHKRGIAAVPNIKTGVPVKPARSATQWARSLRTKTPRLKLANWMSDRDNPFFAKSLVNRYWKHFFNRGLIEPEDDIRDTNPPTNPALLKALEKHFIDSGFDLKALVRVITQSRAYQLSAMPNEHNLVDRQNYSRYYPRWLAGRSAAGRDRPFWRELRRILRIFLPGREPWRCPTTATTVRPSSCACLDRPVWFDGLTSGATALSMLARPWG